MPSDWSFVEVEAVVADYVSMLMTELRREPLNKTVHRRALSQMLNGRSDTAIERKHQNISAVLIELGYPYISGYKPLGNYQTLLGRVVADHVGSDTELALLVRQVVAEPAHVPSVEDILGRLESPPPRDTLVYPPVREERDPGATRRTKINYLEMEARNASLGQAGEVFVVNYERARLIFAGRETLAAKVEHIAASEGDGAGFDVRSYEADGTDRLIEVKTTAYGKQTPIFLSSNELLVSQALRASYHLYRPFHFRNDPKLFTVSGALDEMCRLEAVQFRGRFG